MAVLTEQQQSVVQELDRRRQADPSQLTLQQTQALDELLRRQSLEAGPSLQAPRPQAEPIPGVRPELAEPTLGEQAIRTAEVLGSGFNRGLLDFAEFVGLPVDAVAGGLRAVGIPIPDKPFLGSEFNQAALEAVLPPIADPLSGRERILFRIAREAGATAPMTGMAVNAAKRSEQIGQGLLAGIRDHLAQIDPGKLVLVEQALAASAGFGAGVLTEIFPEGGAASDFIGELLGTFGGSATASLIRSARAGGAIIQEGIRRGTMEPITRGLVEGAESIRQRLTGEAGKREILGRGLEQLVDPETVQRELRDVERLSEAIPGFRPTTAQTMRTAGLETVENLIQARSPQMIQRFEVRRQHNRDAINAFLHEQAPPGDKEEFVRRLTQQREADEGLLAHSLDRTEAKIDAAKGDISARTARVIDETETRMLLADQRAEEALVAVAPRLTPAQAGAVIRREYLAELDAFRHEASRRYAQVDPQDMVIMPSESSKAVADAVKRGFQPVAERPVNLPNELIQRIEALPDDVPFNTLRVLRGDILAQIQELKANVPRNDRLLERMYRILDGVEFNLDELVTDGRLREAYSFQSDAYQELVTWYRRGAMRLKQGTAAKLRVEDGGGRFSVLDEQVADRFLKGETPLDDFLQAVGGRESAREALQERVKMDFMNRVVNPTTGRIHPPAYAKWLRDRENALGMFPELRRQFAHAANAQRIANQVRDDAKLIQRDPERVNRLLGDHTLGELNELERHHAELLKTMTTTKKQWEKSTASAYVRGQDIDRVSREIISSSQRESKIAEVLKQVEHDPTAKQGFVRALWDAALDKSTIKFLDANDSPQLMARRINEFLRDNDGWMRMVFGPEKTKALATARDALSRLEIAPAPSRSRPGEVLDQLYSSFETIGMPLLARFYAHQRGVVSRGYIMLEQVGRRLLKAVGRMTDEQATALLEEAFFDPKVAETLRQAARGVHTDQIVHRLRLHLLTMNQAD